jgi:hypothetical protein
MFAALLLACYGVFSTSARHGQDRADISRRISLRMKLTIARAGLRIDVGKQ